MGDPCTWSPMSPRAKNLVKLFNVLHPKCSFLKLDFKKTFIGDAYLQK